MFAACGTIGTLFKVSVSAFCSEEGRHGDLKAKFVLLLDRYFTSVDSPAVSPCSKKRVAVPQPFVLTFTKNTVASTEEACSNKLFQAQVTKQDRWRQSLLPRRRRPYRRICSATGSYYCCRLHDSIGCRFDCARSFCNKVYLSTGTWDLLKVHPHQGQ